MTQEPLLRLVALFSLGVITMNLTETGNAWAPRVLSILRIMTGLVLLQHPLSKLFGFPASNFMPKVGELTWIAGIIEIVGAPLLILGLFTRPVAFILAGELALAYFIGHMFGGRAPGFFPQLNGGSLAIMYCFACLYIAAAGPGPWSVDAMRGQK
jgi:putative oxidoreductase